MLTRFAKGGRSCVATFVLIAWGPRARTDSGSLSRLAICFRDWLPPADSRLIEPAPPDRAAVFVGPLVVPSDHHASSAAAATRRCRRRPWGGVL